MQHRELGRRAVLGGLGGALLGSACFGSGAWASSAGTAARSLSLFNLHTGEKLTATYWEPGGYVMDALSSIWRVLRDWRTDEVVPMDPRLLDLLHNLHGKMETSQPFQVVSGYRSPKTNALLRSESGGVAKRSMHMRGMAADIAIEGRDIRDLHKAALSMKAGGVGIYSRIGFVHVDTGRVRRWGK